MMNLVAHRMEVDRLQAELDRKRAEAAEAQRKREAASIRAHDPNAKAQQAAAAAEADAWRKELALVHREIEDLETAAAAARKRLWDATVLQASPEEEEKRAQVQRAFEECQTLADRIGDALKLADGAFGEIMDRYSFIRGNFQLQANSMYLADGHLDRDALGRRLVDFVVRGCPNLHGTLTEAFTLWGGREAVPLSEIERASHRPWIEELDEHVRLTEDARAKLAAGAVESPTVAGDVAA